jgi:hypothetical protein
VEPLSAQAFLEYLIDRLQSAGEVQGERRIGCFEARYFRVTRRNRTEEREGQAPLHAKPRSGSCSAVLTYLKNEHFFHYEKLGLVPHEKTLSAPLREKYPPYIRQSSHSN